MSKFNGFTADITVYIIGTGVTTLRMATKGFETASTDTPASTFYAGRIFNPGSFKAMMFSDGKTSGSSEMAYGNVSFINNDGALDAWLNYGFSGRTIVIRKWVLGLVVFTMSCSMEQPTVNGNDISIRMKSGQNKLNTPVQAFKYAGSNVMPEGIEGSLDIKDKPKPLLYGVVYNATPVMINSSKLIYQGSFIALTDIPAVYDKGVPLVRGTDYGGQTEMLSTQPAEGEYRVWLAGGCFRLGSSPAGQITFDGIEGDNAAARTTAQIAKRIALRVLSSGEMIDGDFTAFDALTGADGEIGIYINQETTVANVLNGVLNSAGGWFGFDVDGKLNIGRLDAPAGTPAVELTINEIDRLERQATEDEGRGVPVWKVNANYNKNYTVQTADQLAGSIASSGWTQPSSLPVQGYTVLMYGAGLWIAMADNSTSYYTSTDLITWVERTFPTSGYLRVGIYAEYKFMVIDGSTNTVYTSTNGVTWSNIATVTGMGAIQGITHTGSAYIIVPASGTVSKYSIDGGVNWTASTLPSSGSWKGIASGPGLVIASRISGVSADSVAKSTDGGATWVGVTTSNHLGVHRIVYGNGLYVLCNYNTSFYTTVDGVEFNLRTFNASGQGVGSFGANNFCFPATVTRTSGNVFAAQTSPNFITFNPSDLGTELPVLSLIEYGDGDFVVLNINATTCKIHRLRATTSLVRKNFLNKEYRTVSAEDAAVKTAHLLATEITINTLFGDDAYALLEAERQLDMRSVRRDYIAVHMKRSKLTINPDYGQIINVTYPRYGYNAGKLFVIVGFEVELGTNDLILYLWG